MESAPTPSTLDVGKLEKAASDFGNASEVSGGTDKGEGERTSYETTPVKAYAQPPAPPPWPLWSDDFINNESWDNDSPPNDHYEETFSPTRYLYPGSLNHVRPTEFLLSPPEIVKFTSSVLDLITPNAHLCEMSELIRYILCEISELYEYSLQNQSVECEGEGLAYVPNYSDKKTWSPWNHIYSCCKAGIAGELPRYNPNGKYYVRLYYLGSWRRIVVDDKIPVLPTGLSGLPLTGTKELWPMLLTKALLKIATVTWNEADGKKFSVISALTGWIFEWVDTFDGINEDDLWSDLINTLPQYSDPKRIPSCYTLLKPCKKKKFGPIEGDDTWWMPNTSVIPTGGEDVVLEEYEYEPLELGDELPEFMTYDWKQRSVKKLRKRSVEEEEEMEETNEDTDADGKERLPMKTIVHARSVADKLKDKKSKKFNKKGGGAPPPPPTPSSAPPTTTDDAASERKLGGKKHLKKGKEKEPEKHQKPAETPKEIPSEAESIAKQATTTRFTEVQEPGEPGQNELVPKHWTKVKDMVMGTSKEYLDPRKSKSVPKSLVAELEAKEREEDEDRTHKMEEYREAVQAKQQSEGGLPSIYEIIYSVQKYAGIDFKPTIQHWEQICGKDSPIALVVVLKIFPRPEDPEAEAPEIPPFLQHPIQLTEIRDTALQKEVSDRPTTPLWKRFRWKAWAMKKGIIPMEEQPLKQNGVHAIKAKTPFIFKTDWYDDYKEEDRDITTAEIPSAERTYEEYEGEGMISMDPLLGMENMDYEEEEGLGRASAISTPQDTRASTDGDSKRASHHPKKESGVSAMNKRKESAKTDKTEKTEKRKSNGSSNDRKMSQNEKTRPSAKMSQPAVALQSIHEGEVSKAESQEEIDPSFRKSLTMTTDLGLPITSCGTVWFECSDIAKNLRKFCKFYTSQSAFGSCYVLRREPSQDIKMDPIFQEIHSDLPKFPNYIDGFKQKADSCNYSVKYDHFKTYDVTDYHLDEREGIDSGFYLFSDNWTDQEIIISVDILQDELIKHFAEVTAELPVDMDDMPAPPPTPNISGSASADKEHVNVEAMPPPNMVKLILEPWNWGKDNCRAEPLLQADIDDYWITHILLPPGRNTFRVWIYLIGSGTGTSNYVEEAGEDGEFEAVPKIRTFPKIPFSIRFISQSPIYLGSRIEVQNYMTNVPVPFLKQAEKLANGLWGIFACFSRRCHIYGQCLAQLRRAYCPLASQPRLVNKHANGVHDAFEGLIISLLMKLNGGVLDRMTIVTLRVLFLNPNLGKDLNPVYKERRHSYDKKGHISWVGKKTKMKATHAIITIQKYYRGWTVRRLILLRRSKHRDYKKIEYCVRRIALLLAKETESIKNDANVTPTILPNPPHWSLDILKYILDHYPYLRSLFPFANCECNHIKIQEFEGELPSPESALRCPFFRNLLIVPRGSKKLFCELDLQVYPCDGIYLRIKNNDTRTSLPLIHNRLFLGPLAENENGYTVQCFRWAIPDVQPELTDRAPSNTWKLRLITSDAQAGPYFQGTGEITKESLSKEAPPVVNEPEDDDDDDAATAEELEETRRKSCVDDYGECEGEDGEMLDMSFSENGSYGEGRTSFTSGSESRRKSSKDKKSVASGGKRSSLKSNKSGKSQQEEDCLPNSVLFCTSFSDTDIADTPACK